MSSDTEPLADQLDRLNDELRCMRDVMEDIRTDLTWALQNGRVILSLAELQELTHAADATLGADLTELTIRLHAALSVLRHDLSLAVQAQRPEQFLAEEIERSLPAPITASSAASKPVWREVQKSLFAEADALPPVTLFEPGDAVDFVWKGCDEFGEIVSLDDARNAAVVMLIPSQVQVTVSQDELTKVEFPPDPDEEFVTEQTSEPTAGLPVEPPPQTPNVPAPISPFLQTPGRTTAKKPGAQRSGQRTSGRQRRKTK